MDDVFAAYAYTTLANNLTNTTVAPALGNGNPGHRPLQIARDEQSRTFMWVQFGVAGVLSGDPCYLLQGVQGGVTFSYVTNVFSASYAATTFAGIACWDPNHLGIGNIAAPGRAPNQWDWGFIQVQGLNVVPMTASQAIAVNHNFTPTLTSQVGDGGTGVANTGQLLTAIAAAGPIPVGACFIRSGIS